MSRSFKRPWVTDYSGARSFFKREANKKIRNLSVEDDIADGKSYRKYFESYTICDWKFRYDPDPWIHYHTKTGEPEWVSPEPIYKYNRK